MWKTLFGHCIFTSPTGVKVTQNLFYRWLTFDNYALQTVINRKNPHKPVLNYLIPLCCLAKSIPGSTCLLGLGGAAATHYLAPHLNNHQLIAVEKNPDIITIAEDFFMARTIKNLKIIEQDASSYFKSNQQAFNHILIDLYDARSFPSECNTDQFFKACKHHLKANGILAINIANTNEQLMIVNKIKKQFKHSTLAIPVKETPNIIILAYNAPSCTSLINYLQQTMKIKKVEWDSIWGYVLDI